MNLSDNELVIIHRGLMRVDISTPGLRGLVEKVKEEFKTRGISVDYVLQPKHFPKQRKKYYDYQYTNTLTKEIIK